MQKYVWLIVPYLIALLFFSIDVCIYFSCSMQRAYFLTAYFIFSLFATERRWGVIGWIVGLLFCQSFVITGQLWLPLIIMVPGAIIIMLIYPRLYPNPLYPPVTLGLLLFLQTLALNHLFWDRPIPTSYTIGPIFASMIVTWLFYVPRKLYISKTG